MPGPLVIPASEARTLMAQTASADTCTGCKQLGSPICERCQPKAVPVATSGASHHRTTRSRGGKKAQAGGRSWEGTLEALLGLAQKRGACTWWRTPEDLRRTRNDAAKPHLRSGECVCVPRAKGPPDYVLMSDGRGIAMEAKHTSESRLPLSKIAPHQAMALDLWQSHGGVSVVALQLGQVEIAVPWRTLGPRWHAWHDASQAGRAPQGTASLDVEGARTLGGVSIDVEGRWLRRMVGAAC